MEVRDFREKLEKFALGPDITYSDLECCLNAFGIKLPFFTKCLLKFRFSDKKVRSKYLRDSFNHIKEHESTIFQGWSTSQIMSYNHFLRKFFEKEVFDHYQVLVEQTSKVKDFHALTIKIDELLQKSLRFLDVYEKVKSTQLALRQLRISKPDIKEGTPEIAEFTDKIITLEAVVEDRDQKIEKIREKYQLIKKRKSATVSIFFKDSSTSPEKWDELNRTLKVFNEKEFTAPHHFQNQKQFNSWAQEEEMLCKEVDRVLNIFESAKRIEGLLVAYKQEMHYLRKPFYARFVIGFIPYIEEILLKDGGISNDRLKTLLEEQKRELNVLNNETNTLHTELTKSAIPFFQMLSSSSLAIYFDLPKLGLNLVEQDMVIPSSYLPLLTDDAKNNLLGDLRKFYKATFAKIEALVDKGHDRNKKIDEIVKFCKSFTLVLRKLQYYADLKPTFVELKKKVDKLLITKEMLVKETDRLDELIENVYTSMVDERSYAPALFKELDDKIEVCERNFIDSIRTLKRRLFEIFTNTTSFPDLLPKLKSLFEEQSIKLNLRIKEFYSGNLTNEEFRKFCIDIAYDHDVFQLRNELSHRARRLSDLRKECHDLLRSVQERARLISIVDNTLSLYKDGELLSSSLVAFLNRLENPAQIFKGAVVLENVNETFQRLWIQLEALKKKSQIFCAQSDDNLKSYEKELTSAILGVADTIEEITLEETGSRPNLIISIQNELLNTNFLESFYTQGKRLEERFSFCRPISFFLAISNPKEQKLLLMESKKLVERLQATREFAKSLQYIKTFEEERVDEILEAFEREYVIDEVSSNLKSDWLKHRDILMRASEKVEDEVLLDIGLLDIKALYDVERSKLQNSLKNAILMGRSHFLSKDNFFFTQLKILPEIRKTNEKKLNDTLWMSNYTSLISQLNRWEEESKKDLKSIDEHLEVLQKFCHLLFEARIFLQAEKNNRTARFALIISELRCFILRLNLLLQKARKKDEDLAPPWIPEIHSLRKSIESLELLEEKQQVFEEALLKIFQEKDEIKEIKEKLMQDPLLLKQDELLNEVRGLKLFHEGAYLHYMPAQLTYFQE